MLKLSLLPDEYVVIGDGVVIQVQRVSGGRADVGIQAPKEQAIVRGTVLEKNGGQRPACLAPPPKRKAHGHRDMIFRWNDDRERAVRSMMKTLDQLEDSPFSQEAKSLRAQLERIIPAIWEEDLAGE